MSSMNWKQSTQHSDSGFTLLELLVAATLGFLVLGLLLSSTIASKNLFQADVIRTRINQDLRGTLDIIGSQIRVAGENLSSSFPAIILENNANGANSDRLTLRRNLLDEILKVCVEIPAGTNIDIVFATGSEPGCSYSDNTHNYQRWSAYRTEQNGSVEAFIFDGSSKNGEFFLYNSEFDASGEYGISRAGGAWEHTYSAQAGAVYILEQWTFELDEQTLQLIVNNDTANPLNVAFGITEFQVVAIAQDGSELDSLDTTDSWTDLRSLRITLTGQDTFRNEPISRTLSTEFFPRNILSH